MYRVIKSASDYGYSSYEGLSDDRILEIEMMDTWRAYCREGIEDLQASGKLDSMDFNQLVSYLSRKYHIKKAYVQMITDDLIGMMGIDMKSTYEHTWQKWLDPNYHPERR